MRLPKRREAIQTGNFGFTVPNVRFTQVSGGDVGAPYRAFANAVNQGLGVFVDIQKENEALAETDTANKIIKYKQDLNDININLQERLDAGELQPHDVMKARNDALANVQKVDLSRLNDKSRNRYKAALQEIDYSSELGSLGLYKQAQTKLAQNTYQDTLSTLGNDLSARNSTDETLNTSFKILDAENTSTTGRLGYKQDFDKVSKGSKRELTFNYLKGKVFYAADDSNYNQLKQLNKNIQDTNQYGFLEGDDRIKLSSSIKSAMNQIESKWKAAQAENLVNLQYKMQDDAAKVEAGLIVNDPLTTEQIRAARPSNKAAAERFDRQIEGYKLTMELQPVLSKVVTGTPEEAAKAILSITPTAEDNNFSFKMQRLNFVQSKYQQAVTAREKDPAAWLIQNNEPVQKAYQDYAQDPTKGVELATAIEAQKQIYNIKNSDILPKGLADSLIDKIENGKDSTIFDIQAIGQQFGPYSNRVLAQIQKNGSPTLRVITAMENTPAATELFRVRNIKTSELSDTLTKVTKDSIDKNIQSTIAPVFNTFVGQGGSGLNTFNDIAESTKRLAYIYANKGISESEAVKKAYESTIGNMYTFNNTWRLPNRLNLDNDDVIDGTTAYLKSLKIGNINDYSVYGDARLPLETTKTEALRTIKDSSQWVTSPDETGLVLTLNGLPIYDKENQRIEIPFTQLAELGMSNRRLGNRVSKYLTAPKEYNAGKLPKEEREAITNTMLYIP